MNRLFHRIRWRLVGWTVLVLLMILAVLGPVVYLAVQRSLLAEADRSLLASGDQAAATLAGLRSGAPQEGPRGYRGGIFYVVIGPDGAVRANPQQIDTGDLPTWVQPGRAPTFATVSLDGDPTRVLIRPIP